ncbi:putative peptide deformylase [Plasmopara halstedii]
MTLVFLGNSALRRVSKSVADVRAPAVRRLFEELEKEVRVEAGVGIAAPQLAHNLRMFLMIKNMPENENDLDKIKYQEIINPKILHLSEATTRDFEGCLSVPGYQGIVRRANMIRVQYDDLKGRKIQKTLNDFPARIFQHELDHLNGVMYLDRMEVGSLIHNEEFEAMEWLDVQKLLLQDPPAIPPLVNATNE